MRSFLEMFSWVVESIGNQRIKQSFYRRGRAPYHGMSAGGLALPPPPWKLGLRTKIFQKTWFQQLNSGWLIYFLQWHFICRCDTHTLQDNRAIATPLNLEKRFKMLGATTSNHHFPTENSTTTCYDHFAPRKYQLVAALCLSEWLIQNKRLFRLLFAQYKTTSWLVNYAALWDTS